MEKLLLGFRKPTADNLWQQGNGRHLQKKRFVHPDIRPYDELKESSKAYDRCITAGNSASRKQQHIGSNQHYIMKTYHVIYSLFAEVFRKEKGFNGKSPDGKKQQRTQYCSAPARKNGDNDLAKGDTQEIINSEIRQCDVNHLLRRKLDTLQDHRRV